MAGLGAHEVIEPEGFAEHGPFDVVLELVGAPNLPGDLQALATSGRIVVIGIGGGAKAELNLGAMMGKRATVRASTLRPRPLEEKALTARAMERHVLALFDAARCACRSPPPIRSTPSPRPTSASRPAASSARSCWRCHERRRAPVARAGPPRLGGGAGPVPPVGRDRARRRRRALGVEEYVAAHRVAAGRGEGEIEVLRSVVDGRATVIEARVGERRCAGICDLHDGRIAGAIEYWA